jgi:hypothetical protein
VRRARGVSLGRRRSLAQIIVRHLAGDMEGIFETIDPSTAEGRRRLAVLGRTVVEVDPKKSSARNMDCPSCGGTGRIEVNEPAEVADSEFVGRFELVELKDRDGNIRTVVREIEPGR